MTTTMQDFHDAIVNIQDIITSKDINGMVSGYVNYIGDELEIKLTASEAYNSNGYWSREIRISGLKTEASELLVKAEAWAYNLPNEDDRAIEFMVQRLNKLVDKLPRGHGLSAVKAWEEISKMLLDRAEHLSKHGLPSPESISSVDVKSSPSPSKDQDGEILY